MYNRRELLKAASFVPLVKGLSTNEADPKPASSDVVRRTEWFSNAKWGVQITCMGSRGTSVESWNHRINEFNVDKLTTQLASVNVGYVILTVGQNSGHFLAPNPVYDQIVGESPSKCSKRDLVIDLGAALKKRGIRLLAYLPADGPFDDPIATWKLEYQRGFFGNREFQDKWQKILQSYSDRWRGAVSGWWFDGCYWPNAMYRGKPPNFETFANAVRHGNPDSIVAFNTGVHYPVVAVTPFEDYTAGETNDPSLQKCPGRWLDGENWHMMSYLGPGWTQGPPRFSDAQAAQYTQDCVTRGGNVTWDVQVDFEGPVADQFMPQLERIGNEVAKIRR